MTTGKELVLETVEWSSLTDVDDITPINDTDTAVLDELRAVLVKHNYCDRFGISLLHRHYELGDDEVNVEATDEAARVSTTGPRKRSEVSDEGAIQTMWRFKFDGVKAVTVCENRCFSVGTVSHNTKDVRVGR